MLEIRANQIEKWSENNIVARVRFSVLLRTLVNSTGSQLTKVDFPGNDDGERPGCDGTIEAKAGTPWIPEGRSVWEFGVSQDVKTKAERDFQKSVNAHDNYFRGETTFVFVTPRRWRGKAVWAAKAKAKNLWKDVRAYDASDIEQWLEQSLPAQVWFANETKNDSQHVRSLDRCWHEWAGVAEPPLSGGLFSTAIEANKRKITSLLAKPPERPIRIAADSTEEALAFIAQILGDRGGEELAKYRDRVLVFDQAGVLHRLAAGVSGFIAVAYSQEVERELALHTTSIHSFVVYPRNARTVDPDITLEPASYDVFEKSLKEMGKGRDEILRLANASGRSLTVLRRQLSSNDAVRTPQWAADLRVAKSLVPFLFVGAWNSENEADRCALSLLADGRPYVELETECQHLVQLNDSPVWSVGSFRGVVSKIDLMFAIARSITSDDLRRYFDLTVMVLGEDDPALDLNEEQQWAALIHGKKREFSPKFRDGISETLVLLAVHGENLFNSRIGFDPVSEAVLAVRKLLNPLTTRKLEANHVDLPTYAEAAPDEFLSIIERDLLTETPAVLGLLRSAGSGLFVQSRRTGLLWALEGLSWNPATHPRAVLILARLSQVEINDNLSNKPLSSLESIFRAWMPQTAANHVQRVQVMNKLVDKCPDIAWKLCVAQFDNRNQFGSYSHKPRWRSDGYGYGEPFTCRKPVFDFVREMVEMAISWPNHSRGTLCDLVERVNGLNNEDQERLWELIRVWAVGGASDDDKAVVREKIRVSALTRRTATARPNSDSEILTAKAKAVYDELEPDDLLNKHLWLFKDVCVEESADETEECESIDFNKRGERIQSMRLAAIREIWHQHSIEGLLELSFLGKASWVLGWLAAAKFLNFSEIEKLIRAAFIQLSTPNERMHSNKNLISGALNAVSDDQERETIIYSVVKCFHDDEIAKFLLLAPYGKSTWKIVDNLSYSARNYYWAEVNPRWINELQAENSESVTRLLNVGRPWAAFSCVRLDFEGIEPDIIYRVLFDLNQINNENVGHYQLQEHSVKRAFEILNNSNAVTFEQKASLEFGYIKIVSHFWENSGVSSIPNLERYIELHPEFFVQVIAWTYKRNDGGTDPDELGVTPNNVSEMASRGDRFLRALRRIPGHDDLGELNAERMSKWVATVRQKGAEIGRAEAADRCIGGLLAHAPIGLDGIWPCEPVREVMEALQSEATMKGACESVYNSRGMSSRSHAEGGGQERELAESYNQWGQALRVSHPFVSSRLLFEVARFYERDANREDTDAWLRRRLG